MHTQTIELVQLLEDSLEGKLEKTGVSNTGSEKVDGELREGELEEIKVVIYFKVLLGFTCIMNLADVIRSHGSLSPYI